MKLVKRSKSQKDSRRVEMTVTDKGKLKLQSGFMTEQENLINAIQTMPDKEAAKLALLLKKLIEEAGLSKQKAHLFFEAENNKNNIRKNNA